MDVFSKIFQFNFVQESTKYDPKRNPVDFSVKCVCSKNLPLLGNGKFKKKGRKKKLQLDSRPKIKEFKLNYG